MSPSIYIVLKSLKLPREMILSYDYLDEYTFNFKQYIFIQYNRGYI